MLQNQMYKTHPCRHFELLSGKPLSACSQGENCRFIHPNDTNWRGITKERFIPRGPLATQPHAFRYRRQQSSSPGSHRDVRRLGFAREITGPSKQGNQDPRMHYRRGEESRSEYKRTAICGRNVQTKENIKVEEVQVDHQEKDAGVVEKDRHLKHPDVNQKSPSEVWNAFLQMARLTRESDILSEKQKKEESKTATYTAVEKTLNGISNEMGLAVTPRIDQSTLIQQNCRKTITENNETVNGLCKEVAQVFVADITNVVDKQVQAALQSIRNEADYLSKELRKRNYPSAGVGSRWEGQPQARGTWSQDFDKGVYRTKKRRVYTPSPYPRRSASKEGQSMSSDIMRELEAKIERQAQALINLAQENEKLRARSHCPPAP